MKFLDTFFPFLHFFCSQSSCFVVTTYHDGDEMVDYVIAEKSHLATDNSTSTIETTVNACDNHLRVKCSQQPPHVLMEEKMFRQPKISSLNTKRVARKRKQLIHVIN